MQFGNVAAVDIEADFLCYIALEAVASAVVEVAAQDADAAFQALEAVLLWSLSAPLRDPQIAACSESIRSNSSLD
jgi:hypothetical protein